VAGEVALLNDAQSGYVERMGDYLVGVGTHRNEQPNENTIGLVSGSPNSDDTNLQMASGHRRHRQAGRHQTGRDASGKGS